MQLFWLKSEKADMEDFFNKKQRFVEKLWLFGPFSGDKDDYTDVWMIKITIKRNQIDVRFFQK